jgi:hypothetical protein
MSLMVWKCERRRRVSRPSTSPSCGAYVLSIPMKISFSVYNFGQSLPPKKPFKIELSEIV